MRTFLISSVIVGLFAVLAWPMVTNTVPIESDLGRQFLPLRDFYQKCLHNGDAFDWHPGLFCGYHVHGEGQGGFDHPWHRLLYTWFPLTVAFNIELFVNYPIMFLGAYLLFRRHSFSIDASLTGAAFWTFSGFNLPHYPHMNAIGIVAHVPWLLWATDLLWRSESARVRAMAQATISLMTGSQLLLGYPQYVYFSVLAEGFYVVLLTRETRSWVRLVQWLLAKALGVCVGAAQLLPTLDALRRSARMSYSREFCGTLSLPPVMGLQLLAPTSFNEFMQVHEYTVYSGSLITVAAVFMLMSRKRITSRKSPLLNRWAVAIALIAIPLALGKYTTLFHVYRKLPVVGVFRCPCRYLVLFHMAGAVLAANVVQRLGERTQPNSTSRCWLYLAIIPTTSWLLIATQSIWRDWISPDNAAFVASSGNWIGPTLISISTVLLILAAFRVRYSLTVLVLFSLIDLGWYGLRSIHVYHFVDLPTLFTHESHPPDASGRVDIGEVYGNTLNMLGFSLTSGYVALTPPRKLDFQQEDVLRLTGTLWRYSDNQWHRLDALPRVRMVARTIVGDNPATDFLTIDPMQTVLLDQAISVGGEPGTAELVNVRPGRISIRTVASAQQVLVVSESYHPDWIARLNGANVQIMRAYGDLMAIAVPPGQHEIELAFESESRRFGVVVSWFGLFATTAIAGLMTLRHRSTHTLS